MQWSGMEMAWNRMEMVWNENGRMETGWNENGMNGMERNWNFVRFLACTVTTIQGNICTSTRQFWSDKYYKIT